METIQDGCQMQLFKKLKNSKVIACRLIFFSQFVQTCYLHFYQGFVFIVLFHLLYYLQIKIVKMIPIIFQISIKLKQISPSTNCLVKVKINTYTNIMQTFKTLPLLKVEP